MTCPAAPGTAIVAKSWLAIHKVADLLRIVTKTGNSSVSVFNHAVFPGGTASLGYLDSEIRAPVIQGKSHEWPSISECLDTQSLQSKQMYEAICNARSNASAEHRL